MGIYRVVVEPRGQPIFGLNDTGSISLALGDEHVNIISVLGSEFIRASVAYPDKTQTIPIEPVSGRAVLGMLAPPMAHGDVILVVADAIFILLSIVNE